MFRGGGAGAGAANASMAQRQLEYSRLLQQITSVQSQLQATLQQAHVLKSENATLKESNAQLKTDLQRQRAKTDANRREWQNERKEKLAMAKQHEETMALWNEQLEAKAAEFEELRSTIAPRENMELVRQKVMEELEVTYASRLAALKDESEKYQSMFFEVRRQHRLLSAEFERYTVQAGQEAESAHEANKAIIAELTEQNENLQAKLDDPSLSDEVRHMTTKLGAVNSEMTQLRREAEELRQAKEDAEVALSEAVLRHERETSELKNAHRLQEVEAASLRRQLEANELMESKAASKLSEANNKCDRLEKEVQHLQRQLKNQARHEAGADAMAEEKFGHASSAWETERSQLQSRLEAQEETNDKLQVLLRKLQEDLKASELRRNESVRQATAQMQTKLATAEDRYRQAVTQANKEEAKANEAQMQHREELQRLQARVDALMADNLKAEQEKAAAETKLRQGTDEVATIKSELQEQRGVYDDLEEEYKNLQNKHREHLAREHALAVKTQKLEMTVQHLEGEVETLQGESDNQRVAHEASMQEQMILRQKLAAAERASHDRMDKQLKAAKHDLAKLVSKHKKRADEYKRRLLDTYGRYRRASDSLKAFKSERSATVQSLEDKLSASQRRVKELEREREMWIRGGTFAMGSGAGTSLNVGSLSTRPPATASGAGGGSAS